MVCGKGKIDKESIFLILSKLRGPFALFSSTFYFTMDDLGNAFQIPSFNTFYDHFMREKSKISQLEGFSMSHALVAQAS